jgi:hypothetical protein
MLKTVEFGKKTQGILGVKQFFTTYCLSVIYVVSKSMGVKIQGLYFKFEKNAYFLNNS